MQIKAAVFRDASRKPSFETLEMSGPAPGEVLVRLVATGVCHTDAKAAGPESFSPRPVVLGHEGAGVVEAVGQGVSKVAPGDHVVMTFGSCGRCRSCEEAEPAYCHHALPLSFGCKRADGSTYLRAARRNAGLWRLLPAILLRHPFHRARAQRGEGARRRAARIAGPAGLRRADGRGRRAQRSAREAGPHDRDLRRRRAGPFSGHGRAAGGRRAHHRHRPPQGPARSRARSWRP